MSNQPKRDRELIALATISGMIVAVMLFLLLHGCAGPGVTNL